MYPAFTSAQTLGALRDYLFTRTLNLSADDGEFQPSDLPWSPSYVASAGRSVATIRVMRLAHFSYSAREIPNVGVAFREKTALVQLLCGMSRLMIRNMADMCAELVECADAFSVLPSDSANLPAVQEDRPFLVCLSFYGRCPPNVLASVSDPSMVFLARCDFSTTTPDPTGRHCPCRPPLPHCEPKHSPRMGHRHPQSHPMSYRRLGSHP